MAKTPKKAKKAKKTAKKRTRKLVPRPRRRKPSPKRKRPPRSRPGISVQVAAAKGRPMLTWVGKRPLSQVTAFPAQLVERHDGLNILGITGNDLDTHEQGRKALGGLHAHWNAKCWEGQPCFHSPAVPESGGVLLHGDNLECLATLLAAGYRGKVDLVYIDPPFDSGADYVRKVNLRGARGGAKLDGETYALGEQIQYMDIWANDNYLQFMYERLLVLRGLLRDSGSIYVHCDPRRSHHLRCLMDEVFGPDGLVAEITWKRSTAHSDAKFYGAIHDSILYYRVGDDVTFNRQHVQYDESYVKSHYANQDEDGRRYLLDNMTSPHPRPNLTYVWKGHEPPHFGWRYDKRRMQQLDREGRIHYPPDGGRPRLKRYLDEMPGIPLQDVWDDISPVNSQAAEATGFPTQKPEAFLERLLLVSTDPGDLVLDSFIGSGTTAAVAQRLGRRWIGCDINKGAIQTTVKRLRAILSQQIAQALADRKEKAGKLPGMSEAEASDQPKPCQFGFNVWRVNDYDLQLQHNEAVNIACEHVGVQRTRSDSFFDGTRGSQLVKIVPFDHPLSPVDLEELRRELDARPDETREIMLVCLGIELAARAWIDDWNRLRKGPEAVNRIDVIELRTDPKYGKFLIHAPARAKVKVARRKARIHVEIADFISPTIVERLRQQAGVVAPKIDDWRAMVDSVMIDTAYDGSVFNVVLADIPEKRSDLVEGTYDVPAPGDKQTTVGVKITDMLGEEIVVTRTV